MLNAELIAQNEFAYSRQAICATEIILTCHREHFKSVNMTSQARFQKSYKARKWSLEGSENYMN